MQHNGPFVRPLCAGELNMKAVRGQTLPGAILELAQDVSVFLVVQPLVSVDVDVFRQETD